MFPLDDLVHTRRQGQSDFHLVTGKNSLLDNIDEIVGKAKHATASNGRPLDNSDGGHIEDSKTSEHGDELQDEVSDILDVFQIRSVLEVQPRTEDLVVQGASYQASCPFRAFYLLQGHLNFSDELVSECVCLRAVEDQEVQVVFLLQDHLLLQVLLS